MTKSIKPTDTASPNVREAELRAWAIRALPFRYNISLDERAPIFRMLPCTGDLVTGSSFWHSSKACAHLLGLYDDMLSAKPILDKLSNCKPFLLQIRKNPLSTAIVE
ncbi:MAG: hypothetical protein CBD27_01970 [Rhodospirillaceae bacterium TMED167]|nr:hypothetical protein [Rhodospirillaceae bacterium]OUW30258.1 MAG: hypothetical protein CBD27_01970 [Rhodospirillaceae bacterium TMED167]